VRNPSLPVFSLLLLLLEVFIAASLARSSHGAHQVNPLFLHYGARGGGRRLESSSASSDSRYFR